MQSSINVAANGPRPALEPDAWGRAGISRSFAYKLIAQGQFPRPVKIGQASRFVSAEVDAWIAARVADRDAAAQGRGPQQGADLAVRLSLPSSAGRADGWCSSASHNKV